MDNNKKIKIFKIIVFVIVVALVIVLTVVFVPLFTNLASEQGRIDFKTKIDSYGALGPFIVGGLMMLQIILAFLPGEPLELLAGMCYGTWGGLILMFIASFIGSAIVFFATRKFGRDLIYSFFSKEKVDKIENSKLFKDPKKIYLIMLVLFTIPGTPKDLIVYLAGLIPGINPIKFLLIATFARFPSIISSTIVGENIIAGNWMMIVITYVISFAFTGLALLIAYHINKKYKYVKTYKELI